MGHCSPGFTDVAKTLGGVDCAHAPAVVSVHNPFELANWTLPVVETLMVVGAVAALVHAVRRWRRLGDPSNLALWFSTIVYVLVLEPPLYFPDLFGLQDRVGLIFVHNQFTVQFLYNRLPLYIVAIYPALTYLVYALVQRTGVLERRNPLVGAACVALVFHSFYEIFDHVGPQLLWWAWNPGAPSNTPWLASVPLSSAVMFAGAAPFGMALLVRLLVVRRAARGPIPGWSLVRRTIAVGVLTPLAMIVFSVPYGLVGKHTTAQATVLWLEIALLAGVAVFGFWGLPREDGPRDLYPVVGGTIYLLVFAFLWATALPAYVDATSGRTASGAPIGSLPYAIVCAVVCVGVLTLAARTGHALEKRATVSEPATV